MIKTDCAYCGKEIERHPYRMKRSSLHFCSRKCKGKYKTENSGVVVYCDTCKVELRRHPHTIEDGKKYYCDVRCRGIGDRNLRENNVVCKQCDVGFYKSIGEINKHPDHNHFCSRECFDAYRGDRSRTLTPIIRRLRTNKRYFDWRDKVLDRDGYRCCDCGSADNVEVHHIKEFIDILKEHDIKTMEDAFSCQQLWALENGESLCVHCHAEKHPKLQHLFKLRMA